jgi:multicomponent Na+:H+ antiporter subunit D
MNVFTTFPLAFKVDSLGIIFAAFVLIVFITAGIYSFEYMKEERKKARYGIFFCLAMIASTVMCFAANMVTFYMCFELLTVTSMVLVVHEETKEAIMATLKYLLFSLAGAYSALFGIYFLLKYAGNLEFVPGGSVDSSVFAEHPDLMLIVSICIILGFGVKAGMFPMHAWLPTAHPAAPAPASAILSAGIVKAGILGIIRFIYYVIGIENIRGTWVQTVWMIIALVTVFMGSMLAYREPVLKKRLAYSTESQLSYITFGLAVMNEDSFKGSILHVLSHGFVKAVLFLVAGAIIHYMGVTRVEDMRGVGKKMPITLWCYTIVSLGLIGIPPTGGFVSKWYLATGALKSDLGIFAVIGPVILLISALLTAGYLLPLTINGFLPGDDFDEKSIKGREPGLLMLIPMIILTVLSLIIGLLPGSILTFIGQITGTLF